MNLRDSAVTTGWSVPFWQRRSPSVTVPHGNRAKCLRTGCGKCLERSSQDKALGHEGELFKGTKGNLTPLEFHALGNLSSHSIFCLTGKLKLKFLLLKISLTK